MNNQDAIHELTRCRRILEGVGYVINAEAFDLAISALEKQERFESVLAALATNHEEHRELEYWKRLAEDRGRDKVALAEELERQLKKQEGDRWIPVTEKLPKHKSEVLCKVQEECYYDKEGYVDDTYIVQGCFVAQGSKNIRGWYVKTRPDIGRRAEVIAWRPLPNN